MDLFRFDPPSLTVDETCLVAAERYGLRGSTKRLRGERSHNTLFETDEGDLFLLKIASGSEPFATIDFHARALAHLERCAPELPVARMVPSNDGELVPVLEREGGSHAMRLVTYLPGVTFDDDQSISSDGLWSIGSLIGAVSGALATFDHPAAREFMPWDIANGLILDVDLWAGAGLDARDLLAPARERLTAALESMQALPRQIIHNDGHAGNLLRDDTTSDTVTGIIDFGDLVDTVAVADLGVAGANLIPHQRDPVAALASLAAGFHAMRPMSGIEIDSLPELVLCRLALSMLLVDHQIAHAPHIADAVADERPGLMANLERWLAVDARVARDQVRETLCSTT